MLITILNLLTIIAWAMFAFLIYALFLIARFFELKSGQRSYYEYYLIPAIILMASAVFEIWAVDSETISILSSLGRIAGGAILLVESQDLFRKMTSGR